MTESPSIAQRQQPQKNGDTERQGSNRLSLGSPLHSAPSNRSEPFDKFLTLRSTVALLRLASW